MRACCPIAPDTVAPGGRRDRLRAHEHLRADGRSRRAGARGADGAPGGDGGRTAALTFDAADNPSRLGDVTGPTYDAANQLTQSSLGTTDMTGSASERASRRPPAPRLRSATTRQEG